MRHAFSDAGRLQGGGARARARTNVAGRHGSQAHAQQPGRPPAIQPRLVAVGVGLSADGKARGFHADGYMRRLYVARQVGCTCDMPMPRHAMPRQRHATAACLHMCALSCVDALRLTCESPCLRASCEVNSSANDGTCSGKGKSQAGGGDGRRDLEGRGAGSEQQAQGNGRLSPSLPGSEAGVAARDAGGADDSRAPWAFCVH